MRVLVTGAAGFLGPHVAAAARAAWPDAEVVGLDLREAPGGSATVVADLRDPAQAAAAVAQASPDVVLHLAGLLRGTPDELHAANVGATGELLDAVRDAAPAARVVVTGSAAEYGVVPPEDLPVTEDRDPRPVTDYGRSKAQQTMRALSFADEGLAVCVGRVFQMLGPGMPETSFTGSVCAQLSRIAAAGGSGEVAVGDLDTRRDYLDVTDVASALVALARDGAPGRVYNVCSGESISMRAMLALMVEASGLRVVAVADPSRARAADVPDSRGDPSRIRAETGWTPAVTLEESAARAVRKAVGRS